MLCDGRWCCFHKIYWISLSSITCHRQWNKFHNLERQLLNGFNQLKTSLKDWYLHYIVLHQCNIVRPKIPELQFLCWCFSTVWRRDSINRISRQRTFKTKLRSLWKTSGESLFLFNLSPWNLVLAVWMYLFLGINFIDTDKPAI